jgi:hypothetical protein
MLWDLNCPPETELIESTWSNYVSAQKIDWISEAISQLTANQRAVLAGLAKSPEKEPRGKKFSDKLEIASSSVQ